MKLNCKDYTKYRTPKQLKLPFNFEILIPADDSVYLVENVMEEIDLSSLYNTYERRNRKTKLTPRQMLTIVVYAAMNRIYSSRDIQKACQRDINFMYLLKGKKAPDHSTFARFISLHLSLCSKDIMTQVTHFLHEAGEISGIQIFIDGTKIEANANRYTFVWKKSVLRFQEKLFEKICLFVDECEKKYSMKIVHGESISIHTLKRLKKKLEKIKEEEGIEFVHGKGKHKTPLQKDMDKLGQYMDKLNEYSRKLKICGKRNSYSKTDNDATFMRMKDDYMRNGQLKPAYNLQHGVDSEYITWLEIMPNPGDMYTLIPFLESMKNNLDFRYKDIVADAGYESEENYVYLKNNSQNSYIKPSNYEISKTRKYRSDISIRENMTYDSDRDCYICKKGKELRITGTRTMKRRSGYTSEVSIYECTDCRDCPLKKKCIKGNNSRIPFEERNKRLHVSKTMKELSDENLERVVSNHGTRLRMNRSIQVEGSFGVVKEDMRFDQYRYRGKERVLAQSIVIALGYNMNKLHSKIQSDRLHTHLFELKESV